MAKNDKWGSPYDPLNFGGKIFREAFKEQREREAHRLRGRQDPGCPVCNPETAALGARAGRPARTVWDEVRLGENTFTVQIDFADGARSATASSRPPESFTKARQRVERWIVTAPEQAFDDIVGNDEALGQLRDAIEAPIKHKAVYDAYGLRMPKGALLSGPPGCGKTMFARAAACEMKRLYGSDVEFLSIGGAEMQSMFVGETEAHIKAVFTFAREYKKRRGHPLLVFLDEAEVLLPDRTGRVRRVTPWEESQVATFLAEMDGIQESGAFVLLATNRPEVIDQAVLRDGRCDFKIEVQRPTQEAVETILRKNFAGALVGPDPVETLVFAAMEALYDPHRVLMEAQAIILRLKRDGVDLDSHDKHFLLEHIISGAMAASIPGRAKRHAFARDKASGQALGVLTADVVRAVGDLFDENKGLDHAFALQAFTREFMAELKAKEAGRG